MSGIFSVGDKVRLCGSAQVMAVTDQMDGVVAQHCLCEWHDAWGQSCERWYPAVALVRVE